MLIADSNVLAVDACSVKIFGKESNHKHEKNYSFCYIEMNLLLNEYGAAEKLAIVI